MIDVSCCPVCRNPNAKIRHVVRGYRYLTCTTCFASRVDPLPTEDEVVGWYKVADYYRHTNKDAGYFDYHLQSAGYQRTYEARNRKIDGYGALRGLRVLEVGCGPGLYAESLRCAEPKSYLGIDLNPYAIDEVRRRGFEGRVGDVTVLEHEEKFDVAVFFDLFEHLTDPNGFLFSLRRHLAPRARVAFTTPSTSSLLARVSGDRWVSYVVPQHVLLHSDSSLKRVLAQNGFSIASMRPDVQWVKWPFLVDRLLDLLTGRSGSTTATARLRSVRGMIPVLNGMRLVIATNG